MKGEIDWWIEGNDGPIHAKTGDFVIALRAALPSHRARRQRADDPTGDQHHGRVPQVRSAGLPREAVAAEAGRDARDGASRVSAIRARAGQPGPRPIVPVSCVH